ncbi:MAG TPA: glycosyltransferase [Candidatus Pacearchaeota archaeon]|nr:glycosyltransferase [Candidatus Pacearchaeota archaeon]
MKTKPQIMILHNIISPYRLPLFEELSKKYDLTVYFCKTNNKDRKWSTKLDNYSFNYKILLNKDFGPFVINSTLKDELKENNFDVYIVFENPENAFSILKIIKFCKNNSKRMILVTERKDDDVYTLKRFNQSSNPIKKRIYEAIRFAYKKYRSELYNRVEVIIPFYNKSAKFLIKNKINLNKLFTSREIMPEQLLPKLRSIKKPKEWKDKKIIFHIGYLNDRKGINYLIEAFNKLDRKDTILLIAGVGESEEKLKELAKKNKNIIFLGYKDGIDKANYYAIADFFVLPTLYDVWGLVVNEAFYYGLPVISTNKAGATELIEEGKTGFVIKDKNVTQLANTMKKLLDNPRLLKKMKQNVKKIPNSKIVDIKTSVKTFEKAINYALMGGK